jgi:hypothetical protein
MENFLGDPQMEQSDNHGTLLRRMDSAFSDYLHEAEKLSVLLAEPRNLSSWTSYYALMKQRTAEAVAYEKYRNIKNELFMLIPPPSPQNRPASSVS